MEVSREYRDTDVGAAARRRFGLPVWKVEKIETTPARFVQVGDAAKNVESADPVLERAEPRPAKLPEGMTEAQVWVRVSIGLEGEVTKATISKSGGEDCDAAALEAAKASKFRSPADGGPAISVLQYDFPPKPKGEAAPPEPGRALESTGAPPDSAAIQRTGATPDSTSLRASTAHPDSAAVAPPTLPSTRRPPPQEGQIDPSTGD
jgi:TonB family protein